MLAFRPMLRGGVADFRELPQGEQAPEPGDHAPELSAGQHVHLRGSLPWSPVGINLSWHRSDTIGPVKYSSRMDNLPASPSDWNQEEIALALRVMALHGGNARKANEILTGEGKPIPQKTLETWRDSTYAVEYQDAMYRLRKEIGSATSDQAMNLAAGAAQVEEALIRRAAETLHALPVKDLTKAALNMALVKKNNVETARVLRNEPTHIVEARDVSETLDTLKDLGVVDTTAEEV